MSNDIKELQKVTLNHGKLKDLRGGVDRDFVGKQIGVSGNQIANIESGYRDPSAKGLLRLMLFYKIKPEDIAVIEN